MKMEKETTQKKARDFRVYFEENLYGLEPKDILRFVNAVSKYGEITVGVPKLEGADNKTMMNVIIPFWVDNTKYVYTCYRAYDHCCSSVSIKEVSPLFDTIEEEKDAERIHNKKYGYELGENL